MTAKKKAEPAPEQQVHAVALLRDKGGYRLVSLAMPESACAAYATKVTEPEVLPITLAMAMETLEDWTR